MLSAAQYVRSDAAADANGWVRRPKATATTETLMLGLLEEPFSTRPLVCR